MFAQLGVQDVDAVSFRLPGPEKSTALDFSTDASAGVSPQFVALAARQLAGYLQDDSPEVIHLALTALQVGGVGKKGMPACSAWEC